jgi:hypothetical protein
MTVTQSFHEPTQLVIQANRATQIENIDTESLKVPGDVTDVWVAFAKMGLTAHDDAVFYTSMCNGRNLVD